jgi:hypothetical protein
MLGSFGRGQGHEIVLTWNFFPEVNDAQLRRTFAEMTSAIRRCHG